nr:putative formin-like protein 15b [Arachis hypogaea]
MAACGDSIEECGMKERPKTQVESEECGFVLEQLEKAVLVEMEEVIEDLRDVEPPWESRVVEYSSKKLEFDVEEYFIDLIKVPRVETKLRVFSFKIQFGTQAEDFRRSLNTVNSACEEHKVSDVFEGIEHAPLTVKALVNKHAQFLNSMRKLQNIMASFFLSNALTLAPNSVVKAFDL